MREESINKARSISQMRIRKQSLIKLKFDQPVSYLYAMDWLWNLLLKYFKKYRI